MLCHAITGGSMRSSEFPGDYTYILSVELAAPSDGQDLKEHRIQIDEHHDPKG